MPRIEALEIDDHILEKIESRHGVPFHEVEGACYSDRRHVRRGREGLYKVFGQTEGGRYLLVVLAEARGGVWRVATETDMNDLERDIKRIEAGEAWEGTDEVVEVEVKKPLDKVIPVRLSSDNWEQLRREAHELGVGPTTLARMWILEKLRQVLLAKKSA